MWLFGIYKDIQYFILKANSRGQHNYPYLSGKETEAQREDMSGAAGPGPAPLRSQGQVTWVVAAAPRGAPPPPGALVYRVVFQLRNLWLLSVSGVRLQISRRVNSRMKSRKDILGGSR